MTHLTVSSCAAAALLVFGCSTDLGSGRPSSPFDHEVVEMCSDGTASLGVYTTVGGRISMELHRPGCPMSVCEGSDVYAPASWATVRTSGPDLLLDGCDALSAVGADRLRVSFSPDEGEAEHLEIDIRGSCLVGSACAPMDLPDSGPVDGGPSDGGPRDGSADAMTDGGGRPGDAGLTPVTDGGG